MEKFDELGGTEEEERKKVSKSKGRKEGRKEGRKRRRIQRVEEYRGE